MRRKTATPGLPAGRALRRGTRLAALILSPTSVGVSGSESHPRVSSLPVCSRESPRAGTSIIPRSPRLHFFVAPAGEQTATPGRNRAMRGVRALGIGGSPSACMHNHDALTDLRPVHLFPHPPAVVKPPSGRPPTRILHGRLPEFDGSDPPTTGRIHSTRLGGSMR